MWGRNIFKCFINSETNNKFSGNDGLTAEFYKHFSNEIVPVLLDVYEFSGKLGTMGVTSRTEISMIFYVKKVIKRYCKTINPLQLRQNRMQETLDTTIGEYQSGDIKNRIILHSFCYLWYNWYVK